MIQNRRGNHHTDAVTSTKIPPPTMPKSSRRNTHKLDTVDQALNRTRIRLIIQNRRGNHHTDAVTSTKNRCCLRTNYRAAMHTKSTRLTKHSTAPTKKPDRQLHSIDLPNCWPKTAYPSTLPSTPINFDLPVRRLPLAISM